jgi:hypothetical protein
MTPLEMLAHLAALIPPPRYPLIRFYGVLGPRSSWRKDVVPRPRATAASAACDGDAKRQREERRTPRRDSRDVGHAHETHVSSDSAHDDGNLGAHIEPWRAAPHETTSPTAPPDSEVSPAGARDPPLPPLQPPAAPKLTATLLAPNMLSVRHWDRLAQAELYAASRRIPWAPLLRRTFDVDVERCPVCHGRLRMLGGVDDPVMATAVLERLDIRTDAPVPARARDPTELVELTWADGVDPLDENRSAC